jgi:hypothetical protein
MRSFLIKAALAAALASTSFAGAYAADHSGHEHEHSFSGDRSSGGGDPDTPDSITSQTDAALGLQAMPAPQAAAAVHHARLARIDREISRVNHRIMLDRRDGYLNRTEARNLENRSRMIRTDAARIAENHRGTLPEARYDRLQARIANLNRTIHRDVTSA